MSQTFHFRKSRALPYSSMLAGSLEAYFLFLVFDGN
jgi:hypothetical protein